MADSDLSLLLVEDNPRDVDLFREYLSPEGEADYTFAHSPSLAGAHQQLNKGSFDLIMLDLDLEDSEGISTFQTLHEGYPDTPIVILTGRQDEEFASRAINMGAQDYLLKNELNTHWLNKAIEYAIERHKSEQRYRTVFSDANDPILIHSVEEVILDVNQAACELLGYERGELLSFTMQDIVVSDRHSDEWASHFTHEEGPTGRDRFEIATLHRDGTRIPVEMSVAPIIHRDQKAFLTFVRDITELKERERQLVEANQAKERLMQEIHHRVKNNFQLASSMLGLQRRSTDNQEVQKILKDIQSRIQSMVSLHRILYQQEDVDRVDMKPYLEAIINTVQENLSQTESPVSVHRELAEVSLDPDRALHVGLIITELVLNSLEHAIPQSDQGKMTIRFEETNRGLVLSLQDNGPGFDDTMEQLTSDSLGLKLVNALAVDQLKGSFSADGSDGAYFEIQIPH